MKSLLEEDSGSLEFNPNLACHSWQELSQYTTNCRACSLHQSRTQVVSGRGKQDAELLIVGEGPGKNEDEEGLAFVGESGALLKIMLDSVGLDSTYITNVVRCRPPNNRTPTKVECRSCWGFLQSEIALVKPKAILCLGQVAAKAILNSSGKFEKLMRVRHQYFEYPVWVTYHPAYLLRQPQLSEHSPKWEVWQVLCRVKLFLTRLKTENF
ncbi:MAG: uracil-DNA glycosylase [Pleurocapsa sp. MO_226.B13]|nr:uracil-DNA glycosylase [Pleurocapsa sp. MO_226.B13]